MFCWGDYLIKLSLLIILITILSLSFVADAYSFSSDSYFNIDLILVRDKQILNYYEWIATGNVSNFINSSMTWNEVGFWIGGGDAKGFVRGEINFGNGSVKSYQLGTLKNPYDWRKVAGFEYPFTISGSFWLDGKFICNVFGWAYGDNFQSHIRNLRCN